MGKHTTPRLRLLGATGARWYFWSRSLVRNRDVLKFPMDPGSWIAPSAAPCSTGSTDRQVVFAGWSCFVGATWIWRTTSWHTTAAAVWWRWPHGGGWAAADPGTSGRGCNHLYYSNYGLRFTTREARLSHNLRILCGGAHTHSIIGDYYILATPGTGGTTAVLNLVPVQVPTTCSR